MNEMYRYGDTADTDMTPEKLATIGTALYGDRWQTPLANDLQVADRTMRRWLAKESAIPENIATELLALFDKRKRTLNALTDYSVDPYASSIINVRTNTAFEYDGTGRLKLRSLGFAKPTEIPAIEDGAREALQLEQQRDTRVKGHWVDPVTMRTTVVGDPHQRSGLLIEDREYRGYNLQAVQHPPGWQVNIYITQLSMVPPNPFDPPSSGPDKESVFADAARRVDRLLGTRKVYGIEESIRVGGRITTLLDELRRDANGIYTFRLGEQSINGSTDLRYFVTVTRGNSSEEFDVSKADFTRLREMNLPQQRRQQVSHYASIADDIRWLRHVWWKQADRLTGGDIRRGSATLRRLLVENTVGAAWRHFGFEGQPTIHGPNAEPLAAAGGHSLRHAVSLIVGGGRLNQLDVSMIGAYRAFNPTTGKGPDDEEGFAVVVSSIVRDASRPATKGHLDELVEYPWDLTAYLNAPGAVRVGTPISRRDVIKHFANDAGGVHLDRVKNIAAGETRQLIRELERRVFADTMDGLYFEVLSIGQAIGRAADIQKLEDAIRIAGDDATEGAAAR